MAFTNTRRILAKLEDLLKCGVCRNLLSAPCTLGHCEHLFCRSCADKFLGSGCPTCGATASRIDPRPNEQLLAAVDICQRLSSLLMPRPVTENQLNESAMAGNQFVEAVTTGSQPTENQPSNTPQIKQSISCSHLSENQPTGTLQNESAVMSNQLSENQLSDCRSMEIVTVERDPSENQPSCSQQNVDQNQLIETVESLAMDSQPSGSHLSGSQITKSLIPGSQFNKTLTVENHPTDCSKTKDTSVASVSFKEPFTDLAVAGNNRQRFVKRLIADIRPVASVNVGSVSERNDSRELMWSQVSGIQPLDRDSAIDWSADDTFTDSISCTAAAATSSSQIPAVNNIVDRSVNTTPGNGKLADSDLHSASSSSDLEDEIPDTPPHGNSNHVIDLNQSYSSQLARPTSVDKLSACRSTKSRSLGIRRHIITSLKTSNAKNCVMKFRDNLGDKNSIECSVNQLPQSQSAVVVMDSETIDPTVQVTSDSNPEIIGSVVKCLPINTNQSHKSNVNEESVSDARIPKTSSPESPSVLPVQIDVTAVTPQQQRQQQQQRVSDKILIKLNHSNNNNDDDDQLCDVIGENSVDLLNSVGFVRSDCGQSKILHHKSSSESSDDEVDGTDFRRKESCMYGTGSRQAVGSHSLRVPGSGKEQERETLEEQPSVVQDGQKECQRKAADVVVLEDTDELCIDDGVWDGAEDKSDVSMDAVEKDMANCTELLQKTDPADDELISISDGTEELWEDDKNVVEISEDKKQVLDEGDEVEMVADEDLWKNVVDVLEGNDVANGKELRNGNRNEDKVLGNSNKDEDVASDVTEELSLDDDEETQEFEEIVGDIDREDVCVMVAERVSQVGVECVVENPDKDLVRGSMAAEKTHEVVSDDTEELSQDDIVVPKKDNVEQERRDTEEEMVEIPDGKEDVEKVAVEKHVVVIQEAGERCKDDVLEKESKTVEERRVKLAECAVENMDDEKDVDENILATCSNFVLQRPVHTYERHHLAGNKSVITENKYHEKNVRSRIHRVAPSRQWEDVDDIEIRKQKQEHLRTGKGRAGRSRSNCSTDNESAVSTLPTVIRQGRPVAVSRRCRSGEGQMEKVTSRVLDLFEEPQMQNEEEGPGKDSAGKIAVLDDILDICEASSSVPPHKKPKAFETKATRRRSDKDLKPDLSTHENYKRSVQQLSAEQEKSLETATAKGRRRSSGKNAVAEKFPETVLDALGISDDKIDTETKLSSAANVVSGAESNASNSHRSGQDKNMRPALVRSVKRKSEEVCGSEEISCNRKRIEIRQECNPDESAEISSPQSISINGTPRRPQAATKSTPSSVRSTTAVGTTSTVSSGKRSVGRRIQHKDLMSGEKSEMEFTTPTMPSRRKHSVVETPGSGGATPVEHSRSRKLSTSPARLFASSPSLKRNAKGETLLHLAAIKGDVEWVKTLLEAGFNTNVKDYANWTPLHEACNRGNVAIATLLLDYGALIDVPGGDNETSLHDAVTNGRVECVRLLVSRGASINARDRHGKTPVDLAWTDEMKVALRVPVNTQQHETNVPPNPVIRVEQDEELPVVMTTGLNKDERTLVQDCCGKLGWTLVEDFTSEVTHLVSSVNCDGSCRRTIKFLESILAGLWIVDVKWIKECERLKTRVCESEFEASGSTSSPGTMAPLKARQNKDKQLPGLFDGCRFYFHGEFRPPTPPREDLVRLVRQGGGVVLTREPRLEVIEHSEFIVPYHADRDSAIADCSHYIVSSSVDCVQLVDGRQLARVPPSWIMTCIAAFRLVDQL